MEFDATEKKGVKKYYVYGKVGYSIWYCLKKPIKILKKGIEMIENPEIVKKIDYFYDGQHATTTNMGYTDYLKKKR